MAGLLAADHSDPTSSHNNDPFSSPGPAHQRYSEFNSQLFALNSDITPDRAKRALEAHLAETERRIQDASKLGTTLVQQRKDLADKLKEVETQQGESDITPELRQKLADIEKEYNDVGRETARTFMPRSRVPSGEIGAGSPYGDPKRSISPSKFESQANNSPSKLSVPNRKSRNQPSNRVHDIEFATEISTSLLSQVRSLQALLAEKEDTLKVVELEKSRLEIEAEGFSERLRSLDESENRYKDENWNLETQIHEFIASAKEAADREKKLTQSLNLLQAEKTSAQKELDDIKLSHAKLVEDHTKVVKHHDVELGSVKRNMVMVENERGAMQRKIEELTGQNQELARAVAHQHTQLKEHAQARVFGDEDLQVVGDNNTPDGSPPPSPVKGTPRHSMLESETLKSSLQHAHRMIQNLKGNIHREKTEKLELKRMLQDARDEVDVRRTELALNNSARKSRRLEAKDNFKKPLPKPSQLGNYRRSKSEVALVDETNWEDANEMEASPTRSTPRGTVLLSTEDSSTDQFETANETEDAFETANERGTETEDFQTGSDDLTETEGIARGIMRNKKASSMSLRHHEKRNSEDSTASLSGNEFGYEEGSNQRLRNRASRLSNRRSRLGSEEPSMRSSPANSSRNGTPHAGAQTLFAELGNMDDSELDETDGTPSRAASYRGSATPTSRPGTAKTATGSRPGTAKYNRPFPVEFLPPLPRPAMVDSGTMTDDFPLVPDSGVISPTTSTLPHLAEAAGAMVAGFFLGKDQDSSAKAEQSHASTQSKEDSMSDSTARRPSMSSVYSDTHHDDHDHYTDMDEKLSKFPSPPASPVPPAPPLTMSTILSEQFEPVAPMSATLELSRILSEHSAPIAPTVAPLAMSSIVREESEPISPLLPPLGMSAIHAQNSEPVSPTPLPLAMSTIHAQNSEPISPLPLPLAMSTIRSEQSEPMTPIVPLTMSKVLSEHSEPIFVEDQKRDLEAIPVVAPLAMSAILSEHIEPSKSMATEESHIPAPTRAAPPVPVPAPLNFSPIKSIGTEPIEPYEPRSPKRDGFIFSRDSDSDSRPVTPTPVRPETPKATFMNSVFGWNKPKTPATPIIAEDSTRQSPNQSLGPETPDSQRPFKEISSNTDVRTNKKPRTETVDESSQTSLTADQIDDMLQEKNKRQGAIIAEDKTSPVSSRGTASAHGPRGRSRSQDSIGSISRPRSKMSDPDYVHDTIPAKRPTSAGSNRGSISSNHPPLPSDHKKVIAAAAQRVGSSHGGSGSMGPPPLPASALRANQGLRPQTPSSQNPLTPLSIKDDGTTPRPRADVYTPTRTRSHASSVTSFASELDTRFNMRHNGLPMPHGIEPGTDPRMIQAITQTMIGEYLWKYTRKAGRGETSENRHRRYFWVHPYTRTLYWSDRDPSQAGRSQLKAKSVAIEAVRVVTDDNPMPPGLHRKSLVIITPGRIVKFTAPTGQRHETWFNALSYLLLRTTEGSQDTAAVVEGALTQQDVEEFNPQSSVRSVRRAPPSRSSYNSQATHHTESSPASISVRQSLNPPQLQPSPSRPSPRTLQSGGSTFSRLSSIWKPSDGTSSSRRSRASASQSGSIYAGSARESEVAHDSAEDLRIMIEKQDREADRLENVRACCDGKHDVGSLNRNSRHASHHSHAHSHRTGRQSPSGIPEVAE